MQIHETTQHRRNLPAVQFLQLYVAGNLVGSLAQIVCYRRCGVLGASAAANAIMIFSICSNPHATILVMGIVPVPAWLVGGLFLLNDFFAVAQVRVRELSDVLRRAA
jgi:hypothetical protein